MNSVLFLKELWRRRLLVVLAFVASAAIAILAVFQVSFSPPGVSERSTVSAKGSIQVLVDSSNSPIANSRFNLSGLIARAGVFARVMSGGNVIKQISEATHIPLKQIEVAGPLPLAGEAPGISEGSEKELPYRIEITQQTELPILTVLTKAPTVDEARALAAAAPKAISHEVESLQIQQNTPEGKRVEFRVLGPAQAAVVDNSSSKKLAAAIFVVLLILFISLIVGLPRFVAAWRAADVDSEGGEVLPGDDPDGLGPAAGAIVVKEGKAAAKESPEASSEAKSTSSNGGGKRRRRAKRRDHSPDQPQEELARD